MERLEKRLINEEISPELYGKFTAKFKQEIWQIEQNIGGCLISRRNCVNTKIAEHHSADLPALAFFLNMSSHNWQTGYSIFTIFYGAVINNIVLTE